MEEQSIKSNQNPHLASYKLAKLLHDCEIEKKVLAAQVEELKAQLLTAKSHVKNSIAENNRLAANLQAQRTEMEQLQRKKIEVSSHNDRRNPHLSQRRGRRSNAKMLSYPQERLMEDLIESKIGDVLSNSRVLTDLEDLKVAYKMEKEKNVALERELEQTQKYLLHEDRFHAEKALTDLFLIRKLKAVIEEQQNNVSDMKPLLSSAGDSEGLTSGQDPLQLLKENLKTTQEENGAVFNTQVSKLPPDSASSEGLPTKTKNASMRKTLHRFLGWKKPEKNTTKPKSCSYSNPSLNISN